MLAQGNRAVVGISARHKPGSLYRKRPTSILYHTSERLSSLLGGFEPPTDKGNCQDDGDQVDHRPSGSIVRVVNPHTLYHRSSHLSSLLIG